MIFNFRFLMKMERITEIENQSIKNQKSKIS